MKTIEQLKEKKRKEERLAAQCRESAKNHEANAKRIQDEIAYQQGAAYVKMFGSIDLEEEEFQEAKDTIFKNRDSFLDALNYLKKQKVKKEEGDVPLYE